MKKFALAVLTALAGIAAAAPAMAQPAGSPTMSMRDAGTLTCHIDPGVGLVFGSVRRVECVHAFLDRKGRPASESYAGMMKRAGFDIGVSSDQTVTWTVIAPTRRHGYDMLAGIFSGASGEASLIVGAGTQALVGADGRGIELKAMSSTGQVGLALGFGATNLELQRVPQSSFASLRY